MKGLTPEEIDAIRKTKSHYHSCFSAPGGAFVLQDLANFCKAADTTQVFGDPYHSMINEGRRQVWLHIQDLFSLPADKIVMIAAGLYARERPDDDA